MIVIFGPRDLRDEASPREEESSADGERGGMSQTTETERFEGREGTEKQVIWTFLINVINMITFD